jgi:excisionase family DNA binding protein
VDRVVPGADGGGYSRGNIRPSCRPCNSSTGGALGAERAKIKKGSSTVDLKIYMSVKNAAARYNVSVRTIYRWIHDGSLPASKIRQNFLIPIKRADAAVKAAGYEIKETSK